MQDTNILKKKIISIFEEKVKGKKPDTSKTNARHDGGKGHWLETQMGISHNRKTEPDIFGFEMKDDTSSKKTTFGDWSADYYIYKDKQFGISRVDFLRIFGSPNPKKNNRYSWSGKPIPKINTYSPFGQTLVVDEDENIVIMYSFGKDTRSDKSKIVPVVFQKENLVVARWDNESIKSKLNKKFNKNGWFKCKKDENGCYQKIVFGEPISWESWISDVKKGLVFFDSGMYDGNYRNYSQWRADNRYWDNLITSEY